MLAKMKKADYYLIAFFIALLIIGLASLWVIKQEGSKCIADPLQYSINYYSKEISPLACACSFNNPLYAPFYIDRNGTQVIK